MVLLLVGIGLFMVTSTTKFPIFVPLFMGLVCTIAILTSGKPDPAECSKPDPAECSDVNITKQAESEQKGVGWIMRLTSVQVVNLVIAWRASGKIKSTWKKG